MHSGRIWMWWTCLGSEIGRDPFPLVTCGCELVDVFAVAAEELRNSCVEFLLAIGGGGNWNVVEVLLECVVGVIGIIHNTVYMSGLSSW